MEKLLNEEVSKQVGKVFASMAHPIQILFFGGEEDCEYCAETSQLLEEVAALSGKINLVQYDIHQDSELYKKYGVDKTPMTIIAALDGSEITDYGIRLAGLPAGHEFGSLIQDILLVSSRQSGLSDKTRRFLQTLTQPLTLQVFVTPT